MFSIVEKKKRKIAKSRKDYDKGTKALNISWCGCFEDKKLFFVKKKKPCLPFLEAFHDRIKRMKSFLDKKIFQIIHIVESINKNCGIKNYFIST